MVPAVVRATIAIRSMSAAPIWANIRGRIRERNRIALGIAFLDGPDEEGV
jgi:hypothetical protein